MPRPGRCWNREEIIVCLALYCQIPLAKSNKKHPGVIRIAKIMNRTPSSVHMKIGNFGSLDPKLKKLGKVGLTNASTQDKELWDEFNGKWAELLIEAAKIEEERYGSKSAPFSEEQIRDSSKIGKDVVRPTRQRIHQDYFRQVILASYNSTCCITGIDIPEVLIASHIKSWAKCKPKEQVDPSNGLCLNALHDRAFDKGMITLTDKFSIKTGKALKKSKNPAVQKWLLEYDGKQIKFPEKFFPSIDFIRWHRKNIFQDSQ